MNTKSIKLTAIITTVIFLMDSLAWAVPGVPNGRSIFARVEKPSPTLASDICHLPSDIYIPEQYGRIKKFMDDRLWTMDSKSPMVILVKDAHCVYEAQKNIERILDILIRDYKIDLVCVEGASGSVDTSVFQSMPDKEAREKASDKFVKKGYLTASEALSISRARQLPFTIWGVEDTKLYVEDFKLFRKTIKDAEEAVRFIKVAGDVINKLKNKIYNPELKEFDEKLQKYKRNELSLTEWIKYLSCLLLPSEGRGENFDLVMQAIEIEEEIDFKAVENERSSLIKELEKNLPKEDIRKLVEKSLLFKLGKISPLDYYCYLEQYLDKNSTPYLQKYIQLVRLQDRIDEDALFRELDDIEDAIAKKLFRNNAENILYSTSRKICFLNNLFNLQMSRDGLEYYNKHKAEFSIMDIANFLIIQAGAQGIEVPLELKEEKFLKQVQEHVGPAEEFYNLAFRRDEVLVNNLLKKMEDEHKNNAVIVAGGFHAQGIKEELKEQGIECAEITPSITKVQKDNPYMKLMMDEDLNIEALLPENIGLPLMTGQRGMRVFPERWRELAKQVISGTNLTIAQLEKELAGTDMAATFEELKKFAGVVSRKEPTTVGELKEAIKPESIISWISKLTDEELENYGGDAFVEYLLLWLESSCKVTGKDYREKLKKLKGAVKSNRVKDKVDEVLRRMESIPEVPEIGPLEVVEEPQADVLSQIAEEEGVQQGRITLGVTDPNRNVPLDRFIFDFLNSREGAHNADETVVVDLGVGYPPVTTVKMAETLSGIARVIGVDTNIPAYVIEFPKDYGSKYLAFFDDDDSLTFIVTHTGKKYSYGNINADRKEKEAIEEKAKLAREQLFALLGEPKGEIEEFIDRENGRKIIFDPVRRYGREQRNLTFKKGGFELPIDGKADVVRAANVFIYYAPEESQKAVENIGKKLKDGGIFIAGSHEAFLLFQKDKVSKQMVPMELVGRIDLSGFTDQIWDSMLEYLRKGYSFRGLEQSFPQYKELLKILNSAFSDALLQYGTWKQATEEAQKLDITPDELIIKAMEEGLRAKGFEVWADSNKYLHLSLKTSREKEMPAVKPEGSAIGQWKITGIKDNGDCVLLDLERLKGEKKGEIVKGVKIMKEKIKERWKEKIEEVANYYKSTFKFDPSRLSQEEKYLSFILDHILENIDNIYLLGKNPYIHGFGGNGLICVDEELLKRFLRGRVVKEGGVIRAIHEVEGFIALFHEAGEDYFRSKTYWSDLGRELSPLDWETKYKGNAVHKQGDKEILIPAHTYLRGLGKGARERFTAEPRQLTGEEEKLPKIGSGAQGLQDILFGEFANSVLTNFINGSLHKRKASRLKNIILGTTILFGVSLLAVASIYLIEPLMSIPIISAIGFALGIGIAIIAVLGNAGVIIAMVFRGIISVILYPIRKIKELSKRTFLMLFLALSLFLPSCIHSLPGSTAVFNPNNVAVQAGVQTASGKIDEIAELANNVPIYIERDGEGTLEIKTTEDGKKIIFLHGVHGSQKMFNLIYIYLKQEITRQIKEGRFNPEEWLVLVEGYSPSEYDIAFLEIAFISGLATEFGIKAIDPVVNPYSESILDMTKESLKEEGIGMDDIYYYCILNFWGNMENIDVVIKFFASQWGVDEEVLRDIFERKAEENLELLKEKKNKTRYKQKFTRIMDTIEEISNRELMKLLEEILRKNRDKKYIVVYVGEGHAVVIFTRFGKKGSKKYKIPKKMRGDMIDVPKALKEAEKVFEPVPVKSIYHFLHWAAWPFTIVHELGHWLVLSFFGLKYKDIRDFKIMPEYNLLGKTVDFSAHVEIDSWAGIWRQIFGTLAGPVFEIASMIGIFVIAYMINASMPLLSVLLFVYILLNACLLIKNRSYRNDLNNILTSLGVKSTVKDTVEAPSAKPAGELPIQLPPVAFKDFLWGMAFLDELEAQGKDISPRVLFLSSEVDMPIFPTTERNRKLREILSEPVMELISYIIDTENKVLSRLGDWNRAVNQTAYRAVVALCVAGIVIEENLESIKNLFTKIADEAGESKEYAYRVLYSLVNAGVVTEKNLEQVKSLFTKIKEETEDARDIYRAIEVLANEVKKRFRDIDSRRILLDIEFLEALVEIGGGSGYLIFSALKSGLISGSINVSDIGGLIANKGWMEEKSLQELARIVRKAESEGLEKWIRSNGQGTVFRDLLSNFQYKPAQIGKQGKIMVRDEAGQLKVSAGGVELDLSEPEGIAKQELLSRLIQIAPKHQILITQIINTLPEDVVLCIFTKLVKDAFGKADPEHNTILLQQSIAKNPIALLHEIGEYLIKSGDLQLEFKGRMALWLKKNGLHKRFKREKWLKAKLIIKDKHGKKIGRIDIRGEALSIALKNSDNPHYLLRALQRQMFGKKDNELTTIIKAEQLLRDLEENEKLQKLDKGKRDALKNRIKVILDKVLSNDPSNPITEKDLEVDVDDVDVLLSSKLDFDTKFEIVGKIARFVNSIVPEGYSGNKGLIVASIEAEILKAVWKDKMGIDSQEEDLLYEIREIAKKKGIAPDMINSVYDMLHMGLHVIVMNPKLKMAEIDPSYIRLIDIIYEITGIKKEDILKAFAQGYVNGYSKIKGEEPSEEDISFIKRVLENPERRKGTESRMDYIVQKLNYCFKPQIKEGSFDLDLDTPDWLGKAMDFRNESKVLQTDNNNVGYYLSTYDVIKEDTDKLADAFGLAEPCAEPMAVAIHWSTIFEKIEEEDNLIEVILKNPGFLYPLRKAAKNGYLVLYGCGNKTELIQEVVKKACPEYEKVKIIEEDINAEKILEVQDEISKRCNIHQPGRIVFNLSTNVADEVSKRHESAIKDNTLKIIGVDENTELHAQILFSVRYAAIDIFKEGEISSELEILLDLLVHLGVDKEEMKKQLKTVLYFKLTVISISDTLKEFQNREITIEISV